MLFAKRRFIVLDIENTYPKRQIFLPAPFRGHSRICHLTFYFFSLWGSLSRLFCHERLLIYDRDIKRKSVPIPSLGICCIRAPHCAGQQENSLQHRTHNKMPHDGSGASLSRRLPKGPGSSKVSMISTTIAQEPLTESRWDLSSRQCHCRGRP